MLLLRRKSISNEVYGDVHKPVRNQLEDEVCWVDGRNGY